MVRCSVPGESHPMAILIGADVGGSKTAVGVSEGADVLVRADGPGAAVRPGRALASAGMIAEVVRRALAGVGRLTGDVLLVGAAGAGREPERSELAKALRGENLAERVVVTTDIELALAGAFEQGPGIVVSAGTGSIAVGRDAKGSASADRRLRLADGRRGQRLRDRPRRAGRREPGRTTAGALAPRSATGCSRPPAAPISIPWCAGRRARRRRSSPAWRRTCSSRRRRAIRSRRASPTTPPASSRSSRSACCRCWRPSRRSASRSPAGCWPPDRPLRRSVLARLGEEPALAADRRAGGRGRRGAPAGGARTSAGQLER